MPLIKMRNDNNNNLPFERWHELVESEKRNNSQDDYSRKHFQCLFQRETMRKRWQNISMEFDQGIGAKLHIAKL